MTIITDVAKIKASIKSIGETRARLVDKIQITALSVAQHAHLHGDITLLNQLVLAVGAGMKQQALRLWLNDFAPVTPNSDKETNGDAPMSYAKSKRLSDEALTANMAAAALKPWYDYKTEKPAEDFNFSALLHKLLGQLDKADGYVPTEQERAVITAMRAIPKPVKAKPQETKA